jgi:3-methyladenine DNA glycosylase/8-oxoguanine DNA glycosylase
MADEDTVLEEAMDNLKEAGQRIRATQSLMRSEGMRPMARTIATFLRASLRRSP